MRYIVALLIGMGCVSACGAAPIVFTHEGSGSGTLGGTPFTNRSFVITAQGDTTNRLFQDPSVPYINHSTAEINLSGIGTFAFTTGTRTFVNQLGSVVGFSRAGIAADLFNGPTNAVYSGWDMLSSIGPHSGLGQVFQWSLSPVVTTGGTLVFNDGLPQATFTARIVPEPAAAVLTLVAAFVSGFGFRLGRTTRR